jgi:hypothetical protein
MYYPTVGERVRVLGCSDEFIVTRADYSNSVANVRSASATGQTREVPFQSLSRYRDLHAPQPGTTSQADVQDVLRSSSQRVHQARLGMLELRETLRLALVTIRNTQVLIADSDRLIARWRTLDDGRHREKPQDHDAPPA